MIQKNLEQLFRKFKKDLPSKIDFLDLLLVGVSKKVSKKEEKTEENKENIEDK